MEDFDAALKMLLPAAAPDLLRQFGVTEPVAEWLSTELPTSARRVDLLARLASGRLLHIELQSRNDPAMAERMLGYAVRILERERVLPTQIVLYVGRGSMSMAQFLNTPDLRFRYFLVDAHALDADALLTSDVLESNLLAILSSSTDWCKVLARVASRTRNIEPSRRERYTRLFLVICGLRGLAAAAEQEFHRMPFDLQLEDFLDDSLMGPIAQRWIDRVKAEEDRVKVSIARMQAEAERIKSRTAQMQAEIDRAQAETARMQAEIDRARAETARSLSEQARVEKERSRIATERAELQARAAAMQEQEQALAREREALARHQQSLAQRIHEVEEKFRRLENGGTAPNS